MMDILASIFTLQNLLIAVLGVTMGIVFGAIPGMTATMAVAVFLPLTYAYDLQTSLILLLGLYVGGISGGLIPAVLINIPGTPSSITTCFDGYPMTLKGEGERALKIGITASLLGGMFSLVCLWLFTPPLAKLAIQFSAVEKFLVILFALTIIAALSKGQMLMGIWMGLAGVLVALMGTFDDNNKLRLVPHLFRKELIYGFSLLPVLIGLFALGQMLEEAEKGMKKEHIDKGLLAKNARKFSFADFKGQIVNVLRATEGLIASESANNGLTGGALIPLLSMGIPGDSTTAVLVGAFALQGMQIGPLFISNNQDLWYSVLIGLALCNVIMFAVMFFPIKLISRIIYIPKQRMYPIILLMLPLCQAEAARHPLPHRLHPGGRPGAVLCGRPQGVRRGPDGILHPGAHLLGAVAVHPGLGGLRRRPGAERQTEEGRLGWTPSSKWPRPSRCCSFTSCWGSPAGKGGCLTTTPGANSPISP